MLIQLRIIQFVYYARKFYLHLKSREKEIRLFYFDKKAYLDSKYLRIHFKIATILVGIAIFFFNLGSTESMFDLFYDISYYISIPQQLYNIILTANEIFIGFIANFSFIISQLLFIFDYLCIFITSALCLLGRFTTCFAQTTTALRLLFALTRHFVPQK